LKISTRRKQYSSCFFFTGAERNQLKDLNECSLFPLSLWFWTGLGHIKS